MSGDNAVLCDPCFVFLTIGEEKTIGIVFGRCYRCGRKVEVDDVPAGHLVTRDLIVRKVGGGV